MVGDPYLVVSNKDEAGGVVFICRNSNGLLIFRLWRISWIYLVLLFVQKKWRNWKATLVRVLSDAAKILSSFLDPCISFLRKNVGFRLVFKSVELNLA